MFVLIACLFAAGIGFLVGEAFGRYAHRDRLLSLLAAMEPLDAQAVLARLDDASRKIERGGT